MTKRENDKQKGRRKQKNKKRQNDEEKTQKFKN